MKLEFEMNLEKWNETKFGLVLNIYFTKNHCYLQFTKSLYKSQYSQMQIMADYGQKDICQIRVFMRGALGSTDSGLKLKQRA